MIWSPYRSGQWPEKPEKIRQENFRGIIHKWFRIEEANSPDVLLHKNSNNVWTPEERLEMVLLVISGKSSKSVALENGIADGMLYRWVRKYKILGYNGLVEMKKRRPPKDPEIKKMNINNPRRPKETEYEELIRLRAENEYIKMEIAVIKKRSP